MQKWVIDVMEQFGYLGIFLMMALENIFPPIPSEVVLPFGGFMTTNSGLTVIGVIITATTGSILGAIILYGIGMILDVRRIEQIIARWGHIIKVEKNDIHKVDAWFHRYGYWAVLFCRMVPLIRSLISIPAGMSKMKFPLFVLFTFIGTLIWNILLIMIGVVLGESWHKIIQFIKVYSTTVYMIIGAGFLLIIIVYISKKNKPIERGLENGFNCNDQSNYPRDSRRFNRVCANILNWTHDYSR